MAERDFPFNPEPVASLEEPRRPLTREEEEEELVRQRVVAELLKAAVAPRPDYVEFGEAQFRSDPLVFGSGGKEQWDGQIFDIDRLQDVKDRYTQALKDRLQEGSAFRARLGRQDLPWISPSRGFPGHDDYIKDYVEDTPVKLLPGTLGRRRPGGGFDSILGSTKKDGSRAGVTLWPHAHDGAGSVPERVEAINQELGETLEHEMEHVFDQSYNTGFLVQGLSMAQEGLLKKISGRDQKKRPARAGWENLAHVRISVVLAREALGKEVMTKKDVEDIISGKHKALKDGRHSDEVHKLQRFLKDGAKNRSVDELTRLLNLVAERQVNEGTEEV
jgi:hypothetical protein